MSVALAHPLPPSAGRLRLAQAILVGPLGALVLGAAFAFSVAAPPEPLHPADWVVAAWAMVLGAASLSVGARLGSGRPQLVTAARGLALAHLAFGVVKLVAYGESASLVFGVLDLMVLAALWPQRA
jgi:hypothetical protein